jgi:iron complex outermembrane receptor protein
MTANQNNERGPVLGTWMTWGLSAALILFGAKACRADAAASPSEKDLTELSLEELATVKITKVYGASKYEQSITTAPSDVSIVSLDEIKKSGYRTLKEILNSVTGFYTTSDGAYDYIGTRGFNRPGDYGGRFLVTIDGHRMNDDLFDSAAIGTDFLLDVDLIDRVEVIRGPGSSLYGNNAVFAVINVITRRGRDFDGLEASASYGSYDTYTGRLTYGNRFKSGLEVAISGSYLDSAGNDHLHFPEFAQINGGYAEKNGAARAPSAFASITYKDFSLEGGFVRRDKIVPNGAYGSVFNDPQSTILDERGFVDLKFQQSFEDDWDLTARVYYDYYRYDGDYPLPQYSLGDPLYPGLLTVNSDRDIQESLGGELQIGKKFFERNRAIAGVEYRHDFKLDQHNFDLGGPTYLVANFTEDTVGAYVQTEYWILDNLTINAGARYDYFSSFGSTANPRAALIYSPWTNSTFKAIYGQAFRAPDAFELYYEAPGYSSSQHLQPETIHSYELDYDQVINQHLQLVSALFYYQIDDLISFGLDSAGNSTFGNLASATSKGGEIELDGHWEGGWRAQLSYTYADARDSAANQRLSNSPRHLAKFNFTAPLWREKVFATLEILAMSDRTTVTGNRVDGNCLANFTLFARELVKDLEVSASVYNLFDQTYSDPVGSDFVVNVVPQNGRSFRVKLSYRF